MDVVWGKHSTSLFRLTGQCAAVRNTRLVTASRERAGLSARRFRGPRDCGATIRMSFPTQIVALHATALRLTTAESTVCLRRFLCDEPEVFEHDALGDRHEAIAVLTDPKDRDFGAWAVSR